jgi:hypothetical protein
MPFGPSQSEALLLFQLPLLLSLALIISLLFSWCRFVALLGAAFAFAMYVSIGVSSLRSIVGAFMLLFSGWVAVTFLAIALFVSTRQPRERG